MGKRRAYGLVDFLDPQHCRRDADAGARWILPGSEAWNIAPVRSRRIRWRVVRRLVCGDYSTPASVRMELLSAIVTPFLVMDPLGNVPLFLRMIFPGEGPLDGPSLGGSCAYRKGAPDGHVAGNGRGADALERPSSVFPAAIATKNHHSSFHTDAHISF